MYVVVESGNQPVAANAPSPPNNSNITIWNDKSGYGNTMSNFGTVHTSSGGIYLDGTNGFSNLSPKSWVV
jgi:hypothetical protein